MAGMDAVIIAERVVNLAIGMNAGFDIAEREWRAL